MPTFTINAPPSAHSGAPFPVPGILLNGPPSTPVTFTLSHLVGPGAPGFAPMVVVQNTDANGIAVVQFQGVVLHAPGTHGLGCTANAPAAGGHIKSAADSLVVS